MDIKLSDDLTIEQVIVAFECFISLAKGCDTMESFKENCHDLATNMTACLKADEPIEK